MFLAIHFGFKTFLHTPDAEGSFLSRLMNASHAFPSTSLRTSLSTSFLAPLVVVAECCVWGPRGDRYGSPRTNTTCARVPERCTLHGPSCILILTLYGSREPLGC